MYGGGFSDIVLYSRVNCFHVSILPETTQFKTYTLESRLARHGYFVELRCAEQKESRVTGVGRLFRVERSRGRKRGCAGKQDIYVNKIGIQMVPRAFVLQSRATKMVKDVDSQGHGVGARRHVSVANSLLWLVSSSATLTWMRHTLPQELGQLREMSRPWCKLGILRISQDIHAIFVQFVEAAGRL